MFVWLRFMLCNRRISLYWVIYRPPIMNLRKAHDYIMGALMTGFYSTGIAVSISPDSRFPRVGIFNDYAAVQLHPYGFILSDLARDDETSGEKPIRNAGRIVIELPSNLDVKIYFH